MIYGSVCSGIEAATIAWHPLGWQAAFYSEIDAFPRAVLAHHYPSVPVHGDFTTIGENDYGSIDLLVGGTPCQSFSVAGLREGLADARGNLTLEFLRLAARKKPRWVVWENVPGVLSIDGGRTFGTFLGGLAECGYGFAYRVLDAQYFGVPQKRRRVFVIGYLGDWRPPAAVLFEQESVRGDITPSRKKGKNAAPTLDARAGRSGGTSFATSGGLVDHTLLTSQSRLDPETQTLVVDSPVYGIPGNWIGREPENGGNQTEPFVDQSPCLNRTDRHAVVTPLNTQIVTRHHALGERTGLGIGDEGDPSYTLGAHHHHAIAIQERAVSDTSGPQGKGWREDIAYTLEARATPQNVGYNSCVRRFTPRECERLMEFPDDFTLIPYKGDMASDSARYKVLGNSMHTGTMRWLGERITLIESLLQK